MAQISLRDVVVEFPVFGAHARSLKNRLIAQATGGRLMAGANNLVAIRALDELSLEIAPGDRLGLVGHNGSGKTTLLRVLAGIFRPVAGHLAVQGRVAALLDPSAGIDADATGIENIFLRGRILGLSRDEIRVRVDDIAEFTGLGDYLELPMRTYSAGMAARLGFAISSLARSEILLIDELIGAGDEAFQERARERIAALFEQTSIVVLASHSDQVIDRFCNRVVTLKQGRLVSDERR